MGDHDSEVGKFLQVCSPVLAVVCATPCQTISVIECGAVMNKMVSDSMHQVRIKSFPRWSLLLFELSMALWSLSIALRVARTVTVLCQLAVRVIADCLVQ